MNLIKNIPGYENLYAATQDGKIFSYPKGNPNLAGKWLKSPLNADGYPIVGLTKNKCRKIITVHRLVALTFIPNPDNKPQINHIDGNKTNNHISNLEWCTCSENIQHAYDTGLKINSIEHIKKIISANSKKVINNIGDVFNSASEASRYYQLERRSVANSICHNTKCAGYIWSYI